MTVTLITGGSSGIGRATARLLLGKGHRIVVTGRDEARLKAVGQELGVTTAQGDAADFAAVQAAVETALETYGRLDNVVANAGFATHDTLDTGDPERWREMVLTNVLGPTLLVKAALAPLRAARGRIVLLGSVAGVKNTPGNVYSVTKWAVTALAENTRMLLTGDGVGVTLVAPGRVDTPFWDGPVQGPALSDEDVAATIAWVLAQPPGVDVNTVLVRPIGQAV
ncbi:SDR family oxidoreductase [Nonomuraea typhae]|uniref:SDR family oxidoreductase n=1 Tax=Nonomuraea typhae TaxID=2603600 RepID=UPI0012F7FFBD|nr:SDR family NAD(P)-dependent oxidoreductase [Nonomuraea typhae]